MYLLEQMNCMSTTENRHRVAPRHVTDALCDKHNRGGDQVMGRCQSLGVTKRLSNPGLGQLLVSGKSMEKHGATWLTELKNAVEQQ